MEDYNDRLNSIQQKISQVQGLEKSKEIVDSLNYIIALKDELVYPFINYVQESRWSLQDECERLKVINSKLRNRLFFVLLMSFSLNLLFLIYYIIRG
jgi:hypothetical protein